LSACKILHSQKFFTHTARLPRSGLPYSLGCVRIAAQRDDSQFSLELLGFSFIPAIDASDQEKSPAAVRRPPLLADIMDKEEHIPSQRAGITNTKTRRQAARSSDKALFFSFAHKDWQSCLDYWSVGTASGSSFLEEGMEKSLHYNTILWHSARARKGGGPQSRSPLLPLPLSCAQGQQPLLLIITLTDVFANESRLPLLFS
jgi:hypothetical protein